MNCDFKTMIKIAVGLGAALAVAYVAVPAAQAFIPASAPLLLALVCPIAMIFMMKSMNGGKNDESAKPDESKMKSSGGRRCRPGQGLASASECAFAPSRIQARLPDVTHRKPQ